MNNQENEKLIVGALHNIVRNVVAKYEYLEEKEILPERLSGKKANFVSLLSLIEKIRRQQDSNIPKTIGFFGAQKRGKSSLINCLLGCDLMPVGTIPKSSVIIQTVQDNEIEKDIFKIDIYRTSRSLINQNAKNIKQAANLLSEYASHSGQLSENVDKVIVTSRFPDSKILNNGGVLVDTPGAEYAFPDNDEDMINSEVCNNKDLHRALNILDKTEIILFVERADYLEGKNNRDFYQEKIQHMNPLNIINFKDKYFLKDKPEKYQSENLINKLFTTYGARIDRTICVSSKEAKNKKTKESFEKSNIPLMENLILDDLEALVPEKGVKRCFSDLKNYLKQFDCKEILPDKLKIDTFSALLQKNDKFKKLVDNVNKINNLY